VDYHQYEPYDPNLFARQVYDDPNLFARQVYDDPNLFARQVYDDPNLFARQQAGSAPFEGTQWDPRARAWCAGPVRETERSPDPDPRRNCCSTAGQYCSKHGAWHMS
jgi:hypothetical protein